MTSSLQSLFGSSVRDKEGNTVDFNTHWCPPCKKFTPKLVDFYKAVSASKAFEIVFVSLDNDERQFESYYKDMPWLAIKFDEEDLRDDVKSKYDVEGIPYFIVIDAKTGKTITSTGREMVDKDPKGEKFPWSAEQETHEATNV